MDQNAALLKRLSKNDVESATKLIKIIEKISKLSKEMEEFKEQKRIVYDSIIELESKWMMHIMQLEKDKVYDVWNELRSQKSTGTLYDGYITNTENKLNQANIELLISLQRLIFNMTDLN